MEEGNIIITIDIDDELWERAKFVAIKERISLKEIVNKALKLYLVKAVVKEGSKGGKAK